MALPKPTPPPGTDGWVRLVIACLMIVAATTLIALHRGVDETNYVLLMGALGVAGGQVAGRRD